MKIRPAFVEKKNENKFILLPPEIFYRPNSAVSQSLIEYFFTANFSDRQSFRKWAVARKRAGAQKLIGSLLQNAI